MPRRPIVSTARTDEGKMEIRNVDFKLLEASVQLGFHGTEAKQGNAVRQAGWQGLGVSSYGRRSFISR